MFASELWRRYPPDLKRRLHYDARLNRMVPYAPTSPQEAFEISNYDVYDVIAPELALVLMVSEAY